MVRKRTIMALVAGTLMLLGVLGIVGPGVPSANATQRMKISSSRKELPETGLAGAFMRVDAGTTGNIAYCAQGWLVVPTAGQTLTRYGDLGIPELDYVLYHGYDGEIVTSVAGLGAEESEAATMVAVWLAIADQRLDILGYNDGSGIVHGNQYHIERWQQQKSQAVKDAAWQLYQEGLAYKRAGGGGVEEGCTTLWTNDSIHPDFNLPCYQSVLTVIKQVDVSFTKTSARIGVTDGNDFYGLAGARYDIYRTVDDERMASMETDASGRATCSLAPNTSYYAVEMQAPEGYRLNPDPIPFEVGAAGGTIKLDDEPGTVTLSVCKKDSATHGEAQRGATLEGAEFKLISLSTPGWETSGATDEKGVLSFAGVPLGEMQAVETKAPEGYLLDSTVHTYTVDASQLTDAGTVELIPESDFLEHPIAFDLEIMKYRDDLEENGSGIEKPLEGVNFDIISNSTNEVVGAITTDKEGLASTRGRWFGDGERCEGIAGALPYDRAGYTVREDADTTPEGYTPADEWTVTAEQMVNGTTLHYVVNNTAVSSRLQVVKTDAASGQTVPLAGFAFQVLDEEKTPITQESWYPGHVELDRFITDENGMAVLPERLRVGDYFIREVEAQAPYLLAQDDIPFRIDSAGGKEPLVTVVSIADEQATGTARLMKTCSGDGEALEGAVYRVVAEEDIITPDGTAFALAGETVAEVTTDENGIAEAQGLSLGSGTARYAFVETAPPDGHALEREPIPFELSYQDQETAVVTAQVDDEDAPTRIEVNKSVMGSDAPLAGAEFWLWNVDDEVDVQPEQGFGGIAVRTSEMDAREAALRPVLASATLAAKVPEGMAVIAVNSDGKRFELGGAGRESTSVAIAAGSYRLLLVADGRETPIPGVEKLDAVPGIDYTVRVERKLLGLTGHLASDEASMRDVPLSLDEKMDAFISDSIPAGAYNLVVGGRMACKLDVKQGEVTYIEGNDGSFGAVPVLLADNKEPLSRTSGADGSIVIEHMPAGVYRLAERRAPSGYLKDASILNFSISEDGRIDGHAVGRFSIENDFTKVDISKRDIANEDEIEGAALAVTDKEGNVIDRWTSGTEPHRIEKLAPGTYTLREEMTPRTHDVAEAVEFTVFETGEVQTVALYDEPIEVTGEIDKRQEIADPVADDTLEDEDGNNAPVSVSETGEFCYSLDFRNTSTTWVDEFTVEDTLNGAAQGLATLRAVTTPQAWKDFDGKLNVWYRTDAATASEGNPAIANATLSDGHGNPWLQHESVKELLGEDSRVLGYTGWKLWAADIDATVSQTLNADDLDLEKGERIVGIRFEYGRVERGFATRHADWERELLKDAHDDLADIESSHEERFELSDGSRRSYAPALIHMQVTDAYAEGALLENSAEVHLFRNGGGKKLEAHDCDHVMQAPRTIVPELDQTGIVIPSTLLLSGGVLASAGYLFRQRCLRRPPRFSSLLGRRTR